MLGLAVTLAEVSGTLGASAYAIETSSGVFSVAPFVLPGLLMITCMIVAFSVGSSWGTYAVVFPIALPLAYAVSPDPMFVTLFALTRWFGASTVQLGTSVHHLPS